MYSFKKFLLEHVLSIGLNPTHEPMREKHRQEIHDILRKSYSEIGGYGNLGHGTQEESEKIHGDISANKIKAVKRDGKITAVNIYREKHGRKSIASGTDGSERGKKDLLKVKSEDVGQKRSWGEVSGKMHHIVNNFDSASSVALSRISIFELWCC